MKKGKQQAAFAAALVLLWWWLRPAEVVTAEIKFEGLAEE